MKGPDNHPRSRVGGHNMMGTRSWRKELNTASRRELTAKWTRINANKVLQRLIKNDLRISDSKMFLIRVHSCPFAVDSIPPV